MKSIWTKIGDYIPKCIPTIAIVSMLLGLTVFIVFLIDLSKSFTVFGDTILLEETAQVGDFIGGVVGTLWAFTSVLLFYATLRLQSKDIKNNRADVNKNRIIDIIYKQLDLYEKALEKFKLEEIYPLPNGDYINATGRAAFSVLDNRFFNLAKQDEIKGNKEKIVQDYAEDIAFIIKNKNSLFNIYYELSNQVDIIRLVLITNGLTTIELNELKSLFFRNVSIRFINTSIHLKLILDSYLTSINRDDQTTKFLNADLDLISSFLAAIEAYKDLNYTNDIIEKHLRNRNLYTDITV